MPLTDVEASRIADAVAALRPDWPARSVRALVAGRLRDRAFADVALALTAVAVDPASETPARVLEPGPWWTATRANRPGAATPVPSTPTCPIHPGQPTGSKTCPRCLAEKAPAPDLRAALRRPAPQEAS